MARAACSRWGSGRAWRSRSPAARCRPQARLARDASRARRLGSLGVRALALPAVLALVLGLASVHRIEHTLHTQWHAFIHLAERGEGTAPSGSSLSHSRLLSGAGNR